MQVTWVKQYVKTSPIRATTILAPTTRINDPSFGTIIVSTLGVGGVARGNIPVSIAVKVPGVAPTSVDPTDSSGCSYVLKVAPGTYTVSVNQPGYISSQLTTPPTPTSQLASPTQDVVVVAGGSSQANFQYDAQATYNVTYGPTVSGQTPRLPTALTTTFLNRSGWLQKSTSTRSRSLPSPDGRGLQHRSLAPCPACRRRPAASPSYLVWWQAAVTVLGVPLVCWCPHADTRRFSLHRRAPRACPRWPPLAVTWPAGNPATTAQRSAPPAPSGTRDPGLLHRADLHPTPSRCQLCPRAPSRAP